MRRTLISTLLLASTGALCSSSSQLEVTAVRFWTLPEATRIAIETNGEFRFRSDKLDNPDRIFFDLLGAKPRMGAKGIHTTPVGDKLLKRIRVAETQPGMTRVVLDLESAVDYTASQLTNHLAYPLQLILVIPFIRLGSRVFHTAPMPLDAKELIHAAREAPLALIRQLWLWERHALILWAILATILTPILALALTPILRKLLVRVQHHQYPLIPNA